MSRRLSVLAALIGVVSLLAASAHAQLNLGGTGGTSTSTSSTSGTGGGGTGADGTTTSLGGSGMIDATVEGAGKITGGERYYRAATTLSIAEASNSPYGGTGQQAVPAYRFMGADSLDARNFRSLINNQVGGNSIAPSIYTSTGGSAGLVGGGGGARSGVTSTAMSALGASSGASGLGGATGGVGGLGGTTGIGGASGLGGLVGAGGLGGIGGTSLTGLGGTNQLGRTGGVGGTVGATGAGTTTQNQSIRAKMVVAFPIRPVAPAQFNSQLAQRLAGVQQLQSNARVQVLMSGRTAVLRGTVESAHARDLAERVAMLEPGVSAVQNELVVSPPAVGQ